MKLLLLGGTGEAHRAAAELHQTGYELIYSVAGLTQGSDMPWPVRRGGFGGMNGLLTYLTVNHIDHILDFTHPYATQISDHARYACAIAKIPLWRYERLPWVAQAQDHWFEFDDLASLIVNALKTYSRPFFAMGRQPLPYVALMGDHQHWLLRCLKPEADHPRVVYLDDQGPFLYDAERRLMVDYDIDVLICKNSGGEQTRSKLDAARDLQIPVYMQRRPGVLFAPPYAGYRRFTCLDRMLDSLSGP